MAKRKFARPKGVSNRCDSYAQEHDRRPVIFGFTTEEVALLEGSVPPKLAEKSVAIFKQVYKLTRAE
jgi:hypothetical protein